MHSLDLLTLEQDLLMKCVTGQAATDDDFFGRDHEIAQIWERLDSGDHVLMTAPRRYGKTSIMKELTRQPQLGWRVVYVDVEACHDARGCMAKIVAELSQVPEYKKHFQWTKIKEPIQEYVERGISMLERRYKVNTDGQVNRHWFRYGDNILSSMQKMQTTDTRLLIIIDEFPIAIDQIANTPGGPDEVHRLLSWYRKLRQDPILHGKTITLVGGSIGLERIVHRLGKSGLINDMRSISLKSWSKQTAAKFLMKLGTYQKFEIQPKYIEEMLDHIGEPVPYHVQLFYSELKLICHNNPSAISTEIIERCYEDRLIDVQGNAYLNHLLEKMENIFPNHELTPARKILDLVCSTVNSIEIGEITTRTEIPRPDVETIIDTFVSEVYLTRTADGIQFKSKLVRDWWKKHQKGRRR